MALLYENNVFYTNRRYKDTIFWQCQDYKKNKCKCRCVTTAKGELKVPKIPHSHPDNFTKVTNSSSSVATINRTEYCKRLHLMVDK